MEENTYKIRKDKIKNIAIVFLAVMLALTFFSNSILNRALPEVATQMVAYDTITERVRGTGTVTADDPYKIVAKDSRTIESVAVAQGDMVMNDQVLFYLEDAESEELKEKENEVKAKEEELSKLVLDYMTALLSVDVSTQAYQNIENNNIASLAVYQAKIEESRQKVQNAQNTVDSLNRQILIAGMDSESDIDRDTELAMAEANAENASKRAAEAKAQMDSAEATIKALDEKAKASGNTGSSTGSGTGSGEGGSASVESVGSTLDVIAVKKTQEYEKTITDYTTKKTALVTALNDATTPGASPSETDPKPFAEGDYFGSDGLPKSMDTLSKLQQYVHKVDEVKVTSIENGAFKEFVDAYEKLAVAKKAKDDANKDVSDYKAAKAALSSAQSAYANANNEYNTYQSKVNSLKNANASGEGDSKELQNNLNISLEDAKAALAAAQKEQEQLLKDVSSELSLSSQNDTIADTEKELKELKEELAKVEAEATDATIVSPVEGTVISVSKTAGESTAAAEEVALIQVAGKGMKCSFSVTNDQAAKVKVGDVAQLQNAWYYDDVMVTLSKIKPDPDDPGKRKLLEFTVEGAIQNGDSLSISVGEKSAEYDCVVPNSAIREDKNGKFVLIIQEKSTPFGNRYKAKRVDAQVMASDETKSAIMADIDSWDYVITTSNQPVEAGDQVRLANY